MNQRKTEQGILLRRILEETVVSSLVSGVNKHLKFRIRAIVLKLKLSGPPSAPLRFTCALLGWLMSGN